MTTHIQRPLLAVFLALFAAGCSGKERSSWAESRGSAALVSAADAGSDSRDAGRDVSATPDLGPDLGPGEACETCDGPVCLDLSSDPNNCGTCGNYCGVDEQCVDGTCLCGSNEIDPQTDPNNCGRCGHKCPDSERCVDGSCTCGDGTIDTSSDPNNCGTCGNFCPFPPATHCDGADLVESTRACTAGRCDVKEKRTPCKADEKCDMKGTTPFCRKLPPPPTVPSCKGVTCPCGAACVAGACRPMERTGGCGVYSVTAATLLASGGHCACTAGGCGCYTGPSCSYCPAGYGGGVLLSRDEMLCCAPGSSAIKCPGMRFPECMGPPLPPTPPTPPGGGDDKCSKWPSRFQWNVGRSETLGEPDEVAVSYGVSLGLYADTSGSSAEANEFLDGIVLGQKLSIFRADASVQSTGGGRGAVDASVVVAGKVVYSKSATRGIKASFSKTYETPAAKARFLVGPIPLVLSVKAVGKTTLDASLGITVDGLVGTPHINGTATAVMFAGVDIALASAGLSGSLELASVDGDGRATAALALSGGPKVRWTLKLTGTVSALKGKVSGTAKLLGVGEWSTDLIDSTGITIGPETILDKSGCAAL